MTVQSGEIVVVSPDPRRLIEGLRDTGYQSWTAVEDIIDNSIAAGAKNINILFKMDIDGKITVFFVDDGCGMTRDELIEAMKYGSKTRPNPASLGKFGLGLKTASTAFCRHLSLVSRANGDAKYHKATWDLDHVAISGRWELILSNPIQEELEILQEVAGDGSGTVVVWRTVDRLMRDYAEPGGVTQKNALDRIVKRLSDHCAMVFQRFLDPADDRAETVVIKFDGKPVSAWDPFCSKISNLVIDEEIEFEQSDGSKPSCLLRAFIVPNRFEFDIDAERDAARIKNEYQGIYIYRENRLIHGPDWMTMFIKEPHYTLLRVEFSFDHTLDDEFHIDIKKSQILLDKSLFDHIRDKSLPGARREAKKRYNAGRNRDTQIQSEKIHDVSNKAIHQAAAEVRESIIEVVDDENDTVDITNRYGKVRVTLRILSPERSGEIHVQAVDSLQDGVLWEPCLIDGNNSVRINRSHEYYPRVYLPNRNSSTTIQGLDSFLWALCEAEYSTVNEKTLYYFEEMRREVSRILRRLVEELPEPEYDTSD